ncbi:Putative F0F1-ATPase subunit Ca2+/Mg2+ transporter [Capnocytophaga haemolytica]|uniref:F0F1-ATPase subunit (ATPase_gene1) n=1 Tax=Capnocytophaga haemolytica TaxID=45243 RepID=A0AAX2GZP5_9FLAO|nr:AtpZ/AtpI family protein [Capnocytophaga haemolytica]SFO22013.1 Putative F0F1-ATPase subunit Ca2+/Mg2+ transporter [Capnocytophaga haemolytica]SNV08768.1 Putative F0F1-ATPase subunit (ATPase_gene1) [Capnocytophaga haemolytica]
MKDLNQSKNQLNKWVEFTQVGLQMAVTIVICSYAGVWLDGKFPNQYSLCTVICSLFGVFVAMYTVIKKAQKIGNNS